MAIASLALGVASLPFFWLVVPPILALVFGLFGMSRTRQSNGMLDGHAMAVAGTVLGIVCLLGAIALWVAIGVAGSHGNGGNTGGSGVAALWR